MRRAPALIVAAAVAVYVAITVTYALSVPVGSSADELAHLNYARLIASHAALPGPMVTERQQPPGYYLLAAGLLRLGAAPVALRFISIVLGLVTIACVALAVRHLAPGKPWLAAGSATAVALLPGFQFVSASITDDSLAAAAGALLLLVVTRVATSAAPTRRLLLAVGGAVGVALLAKETDLPVVAVLAGVAAWRWRGSITPRDWVPLGVPVAVIAGWWYARNLVAFHRPLPPLTPLGVPPDKMRTAAQLRSFATQTVRGLFSPERFQGSPLTLPLVGRVLIVVLAVTVLALLVAAGVLCAREWARWHSSRRAAVARVRARRRRRRRLLGRQRRPRRLPAAGALPARRRDRAGAGAGVGHRPADAAPGRRGRGRVAVRRRRRDRLGVRAGHGDVGRRVR